ncbi:hypothetical protein IFM89_032736 [Coptis chinensis]|uniref:Uncharacterized protein n=1 Tax=Coptis chinensis TaxID=261450 RepID=A0A835LND9_9MAGN|nr:hypothetical protein IFM89_032736 [Coptis chinensis]
MDQKEVGFNYQQKRWDSWQHQQHLSCYMFTVSSCSQQMLSNFAVSLLRQVLKLGASITPLLVVLGRLSSSVSFLIFGVFAIFIGILTLILPETRNSSLYETLEQQEEEEVCASPKDVAACISPVIAEEIS